MTWSLAAGDVLAHYRVLSPLGSGGMGQVYLAEDVRLGRKLALKVLAPRALRDEWRLRRFEREARTISALNHPNILTVYDIGHAGGMQFIATEFVDGETLRTILGRERLRVRPALDVAVQVAQALAAAHVAGVVHRDVKPENVMLRADGYVKVLDFGLAKLTGSEGLPANTETRLIDTQDGVVMGTFSYMAPEQARGAEVDARADVFALGVLVYEMIAGEPPFRGATAADVLGALLYQEPIPLTRVADVPDVLGRIVATALRKDREERYQTCTDLLQDMKSLLRDIDAGRESGISAILSGPQEQTSIGFAPAGVARARVQSRPPRVTPPARAMPTPRVTPAPRRRRVKRVVDSLAVLPLVNQSQNAELDYFSDGLTESLINNLSQLPRLRVMARSTVFRYKGHNPEPQIVGRALDVQAVLTGRVVQHGDAFVVGAELVDVDDGSQLWGTLLTRRPSDVFVLQAEISRELTDALRLRLTRDERRRLNKRHTANAEAYRLYLRGRYFLNERSRSALTEARALFERAVAEDATYALAYAGLADCCSLIAVSLGTSSVISTIERARAAAIKALELDDSLAEGHASLAFIKFRFDYDASGAEAEFTRALDLNPGHAPSRQWHAMYLATRSRFDAALVEMKHALELDPLSLIIQSGIGRILHFAGRYDEAIVQFEHVLQTNPGFAQTRFELALTRMVRREYAAARTELDLAEALLGPVSTILLMKGLCAVHEGRENDARAALNELRERHERGAAGPEDLAQIAAALGEYEQARTWLTQACERRAPFLGYVHVEPAMAPLLEDPGCRAILERHGIVANG